MRIRAKRTVDMACSLEARTEAAAWDWVVLVR